MALQYKPTGVEGVKIVDGVPVKFYDRILTSQFFTIARDIERSTRQHRRSALELRAKYQSFYDAGNLPGYRDDTKDIREGNWKVNKIRPPNLTYQYCEIVTPVSKPSRIKRAIQAATGKGPHVNGHYAVVLFADGEDAESPRFTDNVLESQLNLHLALANDLVVDGHPTRQTIPAVKYRPRGMHLDEVHVLVDDKPISAMAFDMALYYVSNVAQLLKDGSTPNNYIPKLENPEDAQYVRMINESLEDMTNRPKGTIHTSLIIETAPALVHMDEFAHILTAYLGEFSLGRYDFIYHILKTRSRHRNVTLPDEAFVSMDSPFMTLTQAFMADVSYRRGLYPQGGMEQWVPHKNRTINAERTKKIRDGAFGEAFRSSTGKWSLHPDSVDDIVTVFMSAMKGKPTHDYVPSGMHPNPELLFRFPSAPITSTDTREAAHFALGYLADYLSGNGASQMKGKMFDAAIAEIAAAKIWERIHKGVVFDDTNQPATLEDIAGFLDFEEGNLIQDGKNPKSLRKANALLKEKLTSNTFGRHIIAEAYEVLSGQRQI